MRGERDVAADLAAALQGGEPVLLALRSRSSETPTVSDEQLPAKLVGVEVSAGKAADYNVLLRGVQ